MLVDDSIIIQKFQKPDGRAARKQKLYVKYAEYLDSRYPDSSSREETVYRIVNHIEERPKCVVCGKPVNFIDIYNGFSATCGKVCATQISSKIEHHTIEDLTPENVRATFFNEKTGKFIQQRTMPKYLKAHGWYDLIVGYYQDSESIVETLWRIMNNIDVRPTCKICGGHVKFGSVRLNGTTTWWNTYCSRACANKDPEVIAKNAASVSKSLREAYKDRGDSIKEKRKTTLEKKYGVKLETATPFRVKAVQDKIKSTILDKYGVDNVFKLESSKKNMVKAIRKKSVELQKKYGYDIEYLDNGNILVKNGCKVHGDIEVTTGMFNNRTAPDRRSYMTLCPICYPMHSYETSIEKVVREILERNGIEYKEHDRTQIKPYELDFWIESYSLAIECNGLWWHSGESNKHAQRLKHELCKKEGITLLQFWEDDILHRPKAVENIIKKCATSVLTKPGSVGSYDVKRISREEFDKFCSEYSLLGHERLQVMVGAWVGEYLVGVAGASKCRLRDKSKDVWKITELTVLAEHQELEEILVRSLIEEIRPRELEMTVSNDILYPTIVALPDVLGMLLKSQTIADYSYWLRDEECRKPASVIESALKKYITIDESEKKHQRGKRIDQLQDVGIFRCYDSGSKTWRIEFIKDVNS